MMNTGAQCVNKQKKLRILEVLVMISNKVQVKIQVFSVLLSKKY